jgi:phosphatidate cytidylyltransferase
MPAAHFCQRFSEYCDSSSDRGHTGDRRARREQEGKLQEDEEGVRAMWQRVLSGLVGLPALVFCVFWRGGLPFMVGIAVLSLIGLAEFYGACRKQGYRPLSWLGYAASALFLLAAHASGREWIGDRMSPTLTSLLLVGLVVELGRQERAPVRNLGATLLGAVYVGWLFSYLILLRNDGAGLLARVGGHLTQRLPGPLGDAGAWVVLLVVFSTWACDTAAFFTGRAFGRHRLAPALSPGKTVEGAIGGWLGAVAMALLLGGVLGLEARTGAALGVLIGVLAQVGDLCESALKRELGVKDFGGLLPGHGGVLDRFDSLLLTAPVVYYVLALWRG